MVMWDKYDVFVVDTDIMSAFDQVDVLNKAAQNDRKTSYHETLFYHHFDYNLFCLMQQ